MNSYFHELAILLVLPLTLLILCGALATVLLVASRIKRGTGTLENADALAEWGLWHAGFLRRPERWLAVKSRKPAAVQVALELHKARSCSWLEGLQGQKPFYIAPPLKGWIVVLGSGLPNPAEDVDECFRFVVGLSRKLGRVQFFSANRVVHHHDFLTNIKVAHQPADAGDCMSCHVPHDGSNTNLLVRTGKALCLDGHDDPVTTAKVKHDPAANGDCASCHNPHFSTEQALLVKDRRQLCFDCHEEKDISAVKAHAEASTKLCVECHDPHAGADKLLLKAHTGA